MLAISREESFDPEQDQYCYPGDLRTRASFVVDVMAEAAGGADRYVDALSELTQREVRTLMAQVK